MVVGARCIVGRGPWAQLQLEQGTVSAEHASIYFEGGAWKVRDLGSRNGTFLNGQPIDVRATQTLAAGDGLRFGGLEEPEWSLDSALPPGPAARSPGGAWIQGQGNSLWLPHAAEPEACVRFQGGAWMVESAGESREVADGDPLFVAGESYLLELPPWPAEGWQPAEPTTDAASACEPRLRFIVSRDQEHVALEASVAGQVVPLGARAHNYPLLYLARRRLSERQRTVSESECGWLYAQDLREALAVDRVTLNLQLWRATQALNRLGLPAERLIERRLDAQQLRIGFSELAVVED